MNRLIIVGNGFDLAHGLPTTYCDFITDYLAKALNEFKSNHYFDDLHLLEIKRLHTYDPNPIDYYFQITAENVIGVLQALHAKGINAIITYHCEFFEKTIKKVGEINWVDLENDFFEELNSYRKTPNGEFHREKVIRLNKQFSFLKEKLSEYLRGIQIDEGSFKPNVFISTIFNQRITGPTQKSGTTTPKKLFLNFNYTNTLKPYIGFTKGLTTSSPVEDDQLIHIHGELDNPHNPVIFGFGDEHNKHYLEFEDLHNDEVFRHIKSFAYFKTSNYHNLMSFLNDDYFEVFIVGHSCGLSDRTMFRQIFEHKNISKVKIIYHEREDGTNDYEDKTISLARHFTDKANMRLKLVSEPDCVALPQHR
ncbi:MAG: AbiH family protein [Pedobacter sp.]|nr:AbiH family protein [Pedobacter sp.]MDQ8051684.1 AbiH family protein [Pedobacter sp.]